MPKKRFNFKNILLIIFCILPITIPPYCSRNFSFSAWGDIIIYSLLNAISFDLKGIMLYGQVAMFVVFILLVILRNKIGKLFTLIVALSYLFYAVTQNITISEEYGLSIVTSNLITMLVVSTAWFYDLFASRTKYTFKNLTKKNWYLIILAIFCFWWPLDMNTAQPSFTLKGFFYSMSSISFCPMTPIFLIILILCKPSINLITYKITAIGCIVIGFFNIVTIFHPISFYSGLYHIPLFAISIYAFLDKSNLNDPHNLNTNKQYSLHLIR